MSLEYLKELNPSQREAVFATEGPVLVLAGAGSGKTRIIVYRIFHLVHSQKVKPSRILAITFTNRAANEMRMRINAMMGIRCPGLTIGTFHATCLAILRKHAHMLGYSKSFAVYDELDQLTLIKECLKEEGCGAGNLSPHLVRYCINLAKNKLMSWEDVLADPQDVPSSTVTDIYAKYQEKAKKLNAMDFSDLLFNTVILFQQYPEILQTYRIKWRYVMVDEYQDTNFVQYVLVKLLTKKHRNICVVGDDDQSIYGWRGADINNILNFEQDFSGTKVVKLEENYRSTGVILSAATSIVSKNLNRKKKILWTSKAFGSPIRVYIAENEMDEAQHVVRTIQQYIENGRASYSDCAVFYRINSQSRPIEEALRLARIPYQIFKGVRFYERKEIRDIVAYLRLINDTSDDDAFLRVVNVPSRGMGSQKIRLFDQIATKNNQCLFDAMKLALSEEHLKRGVAAKAKAFVDLIENLHVSKDCILLPDLVKRVVQETHYLEYVLRDDPVTATSRQENLEEFVSVATEYCCVRNGAMLQDFLDEIILYADHDEYRDESGEVSLMTLHSAKGLEFQYVFIIGMEEGLLPYRKSLGKLEEISEERRLCYVGITRAKHRLCLLCATRRYMHGSCVRNSISRFVEDIPEKFLEFHGSFPAKANVSLTANQWNCSLFQKGTQVKHPKWGSGRIVHIEGDGDGRLVTVRFGGKEKCLALKYAKLEIF